jgi:SecD/SecF fusion protein
MSGQMSDSMRNNALIGLGIAFACIFIYLAIRFEATYATSATICLLHDVLITLGIMGILNALKVPIQIDLNTIAALMTIVGYSLNDTIIIFDRIREEMHSHQSRSLKEIINQALNATLSRTTITSGTTLFVLLALVGAGGASMFSFALVMTIGVFFGTLSSWFIAAPCLAYLMQKTTKKEQQSMQLNH